MPDESSIVDDLSFRGQARWTRCAIDVIDAYLAGDKDRVAEAMPVKKAFTRLVAYGAVEVMEHLRGAHENLDESGANSGGELVRYLNELAPDELEDELEALVARLPEVGDAGVELETPESWQAWAHISCAHAATLAAHLEESTVAARYKLAELSALTRRAAPGPRKPGPT